MNKNVLVTGGAGYVGSHTCKILSQSGYTPIVYDNLCYGHRWAVKWGPFEHGDILDKTRLCEVIRHYNPIAVMHFAAFAYVGESVDHPAKYYRNNVFGTLNILESMVEYQIKKFIFSSTCAIYGNPKKLPITEDMPKQPINPYGQSKLMVEQILKDFDHGYGLKSVPLRYFNAAGADNDTEIGEDHDPETHLIPLVLEAAAKLRPHVTIFGEDYHTPDGSCVRDYIHVTDLAHAHVLALKYLEEQNKSNAYNLGNGEGFSVKEIIASASNITGQTIEVVHGKRRSGDPAQLIGDATKMMTDLGWKTQYSGIDNVIESAWKWLKKTS